MQGEQIDRIIDDGAIFRLLRQDNLAFFAEVASAAFSGQDADGVSEPRMLSILTAILERRRERFGAATLPMVTRRYLSEMKGEGSTAPWFGSRTDALGDTRITLLPEAQRVLEVIEASTINQAELTESALKDFKTFVEDIASRLRGDTETRLAHLANQIAELELQADRLRQTGLPSLSDQELASSANIMRSRALDIRTGFMAIPNGLRRFRREADDILQNREGPACDIMREVLDREDEMKSGPSYRALSALADLNADRLARASFTDSIRLVVDACAAHLDEEAAARINNLILNLAQVSSDVVMEDGAISRMHADFIKRDDFKARRDDARALRSARDAMVAVRDKVAPTVRDRRLAEIGILLPEMFLQAMPFHALELSREAPGVAAAGTAAAVVDTTGAAQAAKLRALAEMLEGEWLANAAMLARIRKSVSDRGAATLTEVIVDHPLRYGLREIAHYLSLAASRAPAIYQPGMAATIECVDHGRPERFFCPNPMFVASGAPAQFLDDYRGAEAEALLAQAALGAASGPASGPASDDSADLEGEAVKFDVAAFDVAAFDVAVLDVAEPAAASALQGDMP